MPNYFNKKAPCADAMFYRSYSRVVGGKKENFLEMCSRTIAGLVELGKLTEDEAQLIDEYQL
jgi:ribonucleotide reductase class II